MLAHRQLVLKLKGPPVVALMTRIVQLSLLAPSHVKHLLNATPMVNAHFHQDTAISLILLESVLSAQVLLTQEPLAARTLIARQSLPKASALKQLVQPQILTIQTLLALNGHPCVLPTLKELRVELVKVAQTLTRLVAQQITFVSSPLLVMNAKWLTALLVPQVMMTVRQIIPVMLMLTV
jgi:hypothetical protein